MRALHGAGVAPEFRDVDAVLIGDAHVIETGSPLARRLGRGGGQAVAQTGREQVGDRGVLPDDALVVAVAGKGKGAVGQREDVAAMAGAV